MNLPRPLASSLADTFRRGFRLDVDARFRPLGGNHMRILWPPEYHWGWLLAKGYEGFSRRTSRHRQSTLRSRH
jgi:hypothetical protein